MVGPSGTSLSALDPLAILAALGITQIETVTPVSGGHGTALWRVAHGRAISALRVFRAEHQAVAARELLALQGATAAGLPVPAVEAQATWHEHPVLLLRWCPGQPLAQALAARPWRAYPLGVAFGQMQARIHAVPPPAAIHPSDSWITWTGAPAPDLAGRLRASAAPPALLHLDYHPLNVLTDGRQITAVLDWANARAGDPRADLARTVTLLRLSPVDSTVPRPLVRLLVRVLEAGWRRGYRQAAGPVRGLAPFYAWAGEVMERDLAPKAAQVGLRSADLAGIQHWTAHWRGQTRLPPGGAHRDGAA